MLAKFEFYDEPLPLPTSNVGRASKYPFDQMTVGGNPLFVSGVCVSTVAGSAKRFGKKQTPEWTFVAREAKKDGASGVCVWRKS